jgi:hypothetical protein
MRCHQGNTEPAGVPDILVAAVESIARAEMKLIELADGSLDRFWKGNKQL